MIHRQKYEKRAILLREVVEGLGTGVLKAENAVSKLGNEECIFVRHVEVQ